MEVGIIQIDIKRSGIESIRATKLMFKAYMKQTKKKPNQSQYGVNHNESYKTLETNSKLIMLYRTY